VAAVAFSMAFSGVAVAQDPVIAAAGDIACAPDDTTNPCRQMETSDLLVGAGLTRVLPLGDIQYDSAAFRDDLANLKAVYDPSWGRVKSISSPVLGNHEGSGTGYFDYFNGEGVSNGPAGQRGKGWYSFDVGSWHIVALNSNCMRPADTTSVVDCGVGSEQEQWLRADLAAHPTTCTLAYWHHPRYSSGHDGSNTFMQPLWQALEDAGVEILLSGHSHNYERFAPLDANGNLPPSGDGIRQFVVGTGGAFFTGGLSTLIPHSQIAQNDTFGVLKLTLRPDSYSWTFVPEAGGTFTDSGTTLCRDAPPESVANAPAPIPNAVVPPPADRTAPVLTNLRLKRTIFRYTLSEDAAVTFKIRRCRRMLRKPSGGRICIRYSLIKTFTQRGKTGTNARRYRGIRRLRPGRYRADLAATDASGNRSRTVRLRFRIVRD
jgi:acid phosphatase type 7